MLPRAAPLLRSIAGCCDGRWESVTCHGATPLAGSIRCCEAARREGALVLVGSIRCCEAARRWERRCSPEAYDAARPLAGGSVGAARLLAGSIGCCEVLAGKSVSAARCSPEASDTAMRCAAGPPAMSRGSVRAAMLLGVVLRRTVKKRTSDACVSRAQRKQCAAEERRDRKESSVQKKREGIERPRSSASDGCRVAVISPPTSGWRLARALTYLYFSWIIYTRF